MHTVNRLNSCKKYSFVNVKNIHTKRIFIVKFIQLKNFRLFNVLDIIYDTYIHTHRHAHMYICTLKAAYFHQV